MIDFESQYLDGLASVVKNSARSDDRTGTGCRKVFDMNFDIDLSDPTNGSDNTNWRKIPALTVRKVFPRTAYLELLWMLLGSTDVNMLKEKRVSIWDGNSSREFLDSQKMTHIQEGHIGKGYGYQFRKFNGHVDQLWNTIHSLRNNPDSRRHLINLWNPADLNETALPPCHYSYQFVPVGGVLNLKMNMRSGDLVLGLPTNSMFCSMFLYLMCDLTGMAPGKVSISVADAHIYENHMDAVMNILRNRPPLDTDAYVSIFGREMRGVNSVESLDELLLYSLHDVDSSLRGNFGLTYNAYYPALPREMLMMSA
jgi:thymidylate synthase